MFLADVDNMDKEPHVQHHDTQQEHTADAPNSIFAILFPVVLFLGHVEGVHYPTEGEKTQEDEDRAGKNGVHETVVVPERSNGKRIWVGVDGCGVVSTTQVPQVQHNKT